MQKNKQKTHNKTEKAASAVRSSCCCSAATCCAALPGWMCSRCNLYFLPGRLWSTAPPGLSAPPEHTRDGQSRKSHFWHWLPMCSFRKRISLACHVSLPLVHLSNPCPKETLNKKKKKETRTRIRKVQCFHLKHSQTQIDAVFMACEKKSSSKCFRKVCNFSKEKYIR